MGQQQFAPFFRADFEHILNEGVRQGVNFTNCGTARAAQAKR